MNDDVDKCMQDFPYYFEDDVDHWLLWSTSGPLSPAAIEQETQQKFADKDHLIFINPAALQSIRDVSCCFMDLILFPYLHLSSAYLFWALVLTNYLYLACESC